MTSLFFIAPWQGQLSADDLATLKSTDHLNYQPVWAVGNAGAASWSAAAPSVKGLHELIVYTDPGNKRTLVIKGQILNRKRFSQNNDSNVFAQAVLDLIDSHPETWPSRIEGQFMILLWNHETRTLIAATDPMGVEQFFWRRVENLFALATAGRQLMKLRTCPEPNKALLANYLVEDVMTTRGFGTSETYFQDIYRINPGHILKIDEKGATQKEYFSLTRLFNLPKAQSPDPAEYRDLLRNTVHKMASASPGGLACTLSGGLDSPAIAKLLFEKASSEHPVKTISMGNMGQGIDESSHVKKVIEGMPASPVWVETSATNMFSAFEESTRALESPMFSPSPAVFFLLKKAASEAHVHYLFGGLGADEILGGLNLGYLADLLFQGRLFMFISELCKYQAKDPIRLRLSTWRLIREQVLKTPGTGRRHVPAWIRANIAEQFDLASFGTYLKQPAGLSNFDARTVILLGKTFTQAFLHYERQFARTWGIVNQFPYINTRILEYAARLPWEERMSEGIYKRHHRAAFAQIIPQVIVKQTKKTLLPEVHDHWLLNLHKKEVEAVILNDGFWCEFLDPSKVRQEYRNYSEATDFSTRNHYRRSTWRALSLELFYNSFWS